MKTYALIDKESLVVVNIVVADDEFTNDEFYTHEADTDCEIGGTYSIIEKCFKRKESDPPTHEQVISKYTAGVQQHLDTFARTRNYDGILSAATYATSTVPKFAAEGQYAVEARDTTWAKCYEILAAVEEGSRPMPTLDELLAELPVLTWPN